MTPRNRRKATSLAGKTANLSIAAPQVIAHRVARMAMSGPLPSDRDRVEFTRMVSEKQLAFTEAWFAMVTQSFTAWQSISTAMLCSVWSPWIGGSSAPTELASRMQAATLDVLGKGLAPVHRTAVANAKRLSRTTLR